MRHRLQVLAITEGTVVKSMQRCYHCSRGIKKGIAAYVHGYVCECNEKAAKVLLQWLQGNYWVRAAPQVSVG